MAEYDGINNIDLDLPSQVEYNRRKNVEQDNTLSTLSSQVQQILSQRPSGFLPRVYYGLTRGTQTYRFVADWVINVGGLSGNVGDAFEFVSQNETQNYIPGIGIMINATQLQIAVQGDYDINETDFDIINMRTGAVVSDSLGSVLAQQPASYLGDYDAATNEDKQITVLYDLETNKENVIFASVDFNNDGIYNWIRIGGYSNGVDGKSIYSISNATASTVFSGAKIGDSVVAGEIFTYSGYTFDIGDMYSISALSPLTLTADGNIRGPKGDQGDQGNPGANGTNGYTPYIQDGNWYINGVDTGVQAQGQNGTNGSNGQSFQMNSGLYSVPANWGDPGNVDGDGNALLQLPTLPQASGMTGYAYVVYDPLTTPLDPFYDLYFCNDNDNDWTIIHPYSGLKGADGVNGETPYIQDGDWYIGGVDTGVQAQGPTGATGPTPVITGAATVDNNTGVPAVTVVKTGTDAAPTLTFNFTNLKGPQGSTGPTGATPNISVTATQLAEGASPTASISGTPENPTITFGIPKGDTGNGFPAGGTTGQYFRKASNTDYDTEWHTLGSGDITSALGYTPYNSSNPSGYITSSAITGKADVDASNLTSTNIDSWASILGVERVETIYDKDSANASVNWGYTSGITSGTSVTGKDFSKYKRLRIYYCAKNGSVASDSWGRNNILEIDLSNLINFGYSASSKLRYLKASDNYDGSTVVTINSSKTEFLLSMLDGTNNNTSSFTYKIEGVY